jgi:hypothetical protein
VINEVFEIRVVQGKRLRICIIVMQILQR